MSASQKPTSPSSPQNSATTNRNDLLDELVKEYAVADRFAKEVQSYSKEAGIPAINELRYAGYHHLRAVKDGYAKPNERELNRAINHAKRASYEAMEAGILITLDEILNFRDEFNDIVISEVVKDWPTIQADGLRIRDVLVADRSDDEGRELDYENYQEHFQLLKGHCNTLMCARDDLLKKRTSLIQDNRRFGLNMGLTILAIVFTVLFGLFAISS